MQVNKTPGEGARPEAVQRSTAPQAQRQPAGSGTPGPSRTDQVQISDAGLTLADAARNEAPAAADSGRADEIRAKILSGIYDAPAVMDQVARAILRSGDL